MFDTTPLPTFLGRSAHVAAALTGRGISPGQPILIAGAGPRDLWLGYLGAVLAGGLPALLPIRPGLDRAEVNRRRLAEACGQLPDGVLLLGLGADGSPCVEPGPLPWVPLTDRDDPMEPAEVLAMLDASVVTPDIALHLQLTSGSTGTAKPVVVTHGNVTGNVAALADRIGLLPRHHLVCWLPLYHDLALVGSALASLVTGSHLRLLAPFDFLADPVHWLRAIASVPDAVSAAPSFALDLTTRRVDPAAVADLDLSRWSVCLTGAEPVDPRTVHRFNRRFEALGLGSEVIRPGYGLAEATLVVSLAHPGPPRAVAVTGGPVPALGPIGLGAVRSLTGAEPLPADRPWVARLGPPMEGIELEVVDGATGAPVGEGVCGEVMVAGPSVSPGYRNPDGTLEPFPGGWCRTGDLGFVHQGELHLVERRSVTIIVRGRNWSATSLEAQLAHEAGLAIDRCAVLQTSVEPGGAGSGAGGEVAVVVERVRGTGDDELLRRVADACRHLEVPIDVVLLTGRNALPRTTSGKKQHHELRAGLRRGEIPIVARIVPGGRGSGQDAGAGGSGPVIDLATEEEGLLALVGSHARRRGWRGAVVSPGMHLQDDLGFDSLTLIELVTDAEQVLGLAIAEEVLGELVDVSDLQRLARPGTHGRSPGGTGEQLALLRTGIPQRNRLVHAQRGRQLLVDGRWVTDLASVNYLGLDLAPDVLDRVAPLIGRWGAHPSWTRAVASPRPYQQLEAALAGLVGAPDALVFSSISLAHLGLLSLLAPPGTTLVVDRSAHRSLQEGAELAVARGAALRWFDHADLATLLAAIDRCSGRPIVVVDGVYSMTGTVPDLAAIVDLTAAAGGLVYVDDAHGIGVLGRDPGRPEPYGSGGGGVVAHLGLGYDNIVYVGGLSKAFSSMGAFVTCRDAEERARFEQASTAVFSGPVPVASLATALAGLAVNAERGDGLRRQLHRLTTRAIDGVRERGWAVDNPLAFPVINLVTGGVERTIAASRVMWDHGILFTPSVFPAAPLDRGGFRISFTAANTEGDVDRLLAALDAVGAALGPPPGRALLSPA